MPRAKLKPTEEDRRKVRSMSACGATQPGFRPCDVVLAFFDEGSHRRPSTQCRKWRDVKWLPSRRSENT
jgi:hypothetical protein